MSELQGKATTDPTAAQPAEHKKNSDDSSSNSSGPSDMSEDSDLSDGSESEDDSSDNETLASRHNSLKRTATAGDHSAKRRRSSSDSGSRSSHGRKRRNLFPVIRKSQRCGTCHTCLNPQLKKACLTVREQMMREARQGSQPAARRTAQQTPRSSSTADAESYTDILVKFINTQGGVTSTAQVQPFIAALSKFKSSVARTLPSTVLGLSSQAVLVEFMARGGVDVLSGWMLQAMEDDDAQASQLLVEILSTLKKLPVTKAFVQSTKSAKVVGALRKHDNADVRKLARDVVATWMKAIPPSNSKAISAQPVAPRAGAAAAGSVRDRPAGTAPAGSAAQPTAKRPRTAQAPASGARTAAPAVQPRPAVNGVGASRVSATGGIHVVSDNDLFKVATRPKTPARLQGLNKLQPKKVQTIETSEASRLLSGKPAAAATTVTAAATPALSQQLQQPHVQLHISVDEAQQSIAVTLSVIQPAAASASSKPAAAAGSTSVSKAPSTSSVSRLPGRRLGFGAGLGVKLAGDNSISALLGGAWATSSADGGVDVVDGEGRAAKKARKGPAKRVSWRSERELVAVRWFIKEDPPAQACKDAHLSDEQMRALAAAQQQHHNAFSQAARMEHLRERQIIEQQHKEAQEAAARMRAQVEAMQPTTDWYGSPPAVTLDASWQVAAGEDSTEAQQHILPLEQLMAALEAVNPRAEPLETHQLLQLPSALFNVPFHDRNVKIVPMHTAVQSAPPPPSPAAVAPHPPPLMTQQQQSAMGLPLTTPMQQQQQPLPPPMQQHQQQGLPGPPQQPSMLPGQQQQQPGVLQLQQIAPPGPQGGQLVMQPIAAPQQQQQQLQLPQLFPGPPSSGGPVSGGEQQQQQLMQALQSLSQGGLLQALQGGGQMSLGSATGQPLPQQQQQQQMLPHPQQMAPGQQQQFSGLPLQPHQAANSAPQQVVTMPQSGVPMQVVMPDGRVATIVASGQPGQPGQPMQLPPGVMLMPQQQQTQQVMQVQQPGGHPQLQQQQQQQQFGSGGPLPVGIHEQQRLEHADDHGDQRWGVGRGQGSSDGGRGTKGRGAGRGRHRHGDHGHQEWRQNKRECKFFASPRGCHKGDKCDFMHVVPGEKFDVRDKRRAQQG